jgi:hypothetical protein
MLSLAAPERCFDRTPAWHPAVVLLLSLATTLGACSTAPQSFESPEAAADAFIAALRANDRASLERIFGPGVEDALNSGDEVADANDRDEFARLYDESHRLVDSGGTMTLEVGETDWPFPIPLVQEDRGWFFDTDAGLDEMLSRRIGRNELAAIQVCLAIADAQREYASAHFAGSEWREYARQFASDPGKRNGLYWKSRPGEPQSPLGELAASAAAEGYTAAGAGEGPRPYYGYYYRILTAQGPAAPGGAMNYVANGHMIGGFAVVAWPAEYANSGLKTFLVSHHGVVYEKDLGDDTDSIARATTAFDPGPGWSRVSEEP